jgi:hypothetical protein
MPSSPFKLSADSRHSMLNLLRALALTLAALVGACGQVRQGDAASGAGGEAGTGGLQAGASVGAAGGRASTAFGGTGVALGGTANLGDGGTAPVDPLVAVPLADTQQCGNDFVRVDELPDMPWFITGVIDGEATEVQGSSDDASLPTVGIFRFGSHHVEHVGFAFALAPRGYTSSINVSAVDCGVYGYLSEAMMPPLFAMDVGIFRSTTYSVDGYEGITIGTLHAEWSNEAGEQHVFDATFALQSFMPDARIRD